ncbi:MAG TPA: YoaK family protein, partial [Brevundimonas sp.]|nr:YoaK family protein [Brevundimonas sp.]
MLLLSMTTGLVDAISVLGLGKVFTANMTGNIVFLGFAAAGAPGFKPIPYVVAIAAFLIGATIAGRTSKAHLGKPLRRWLITASVIEAGLLWTAALVAIGFDVASQSPSPRLFVIIALTAIAMGFRNATIRQLKVPDLTTTVLTLTLTGLAADSSLAGGANPNWRRRVGGVLAIL